MHVAQPDVSVKASIRPSIDMLNSPLLSLRAKFDYYLYNNAGIVRFKLSWCLRSSSNHLCIPQSSEGDACGLPYAQLLAVLRANVAAPVLPAQWSSSS